MERVNLSEEIVNEAADYLPLELKCGLALILAPGCVYRDEHAQPPLYVENVVGRKKMELFVLAGYYLRLLDVSGLEEGKFVFPSEQYDAMALLPDQLKRRGGKSTAVWRDYKCFLDILDREVKNELARKNDPLKRLSESLTMGLNPDMFQQLQKEIEAVKAGETAGEGAEAE